QDGPAAPPLRAVGVAGDHGHRALLDRRGAGRGLRPGAVLRRLPGPRGHRMSGGLGHVAVLGAGRSGQAAARALAARQPRSLVVVGERDSDTTRAAGEALRADGIAVVIGPDAATDLLRRDPRPDLVVTSPGVPQSHPLLAAGIPVWSEPELAVRLNA